MGEGWGSGCRIQQCPSTETGGHGLRGGHMAQSGVETGGHGLAQGTHVDTGLRYWYCKGKSELPARCAWG